MLKKSSLFILLTCALAATGMAQNTNSSTTTTPTTRTRTSTKTPTKTTPKPSNIEEQGTQEETSNQNTTRTRRTRSPQTTTKDPGAKGVLAAFEDLLKGIRNADIEAVTAAYWNSPQLILFNNNGTVTKG
jgi:hypothetical protein